MANAAKKKNSWPLARKLCIVATLFSNSFFILELKIQHYYAKLFLSRNISRINKNTTMMHVKKFFYLFYL